MIQIIVILVVIVLIVLLVKNTKESFEDHNYLSKVYNKMRESTYSAQTGGSECPPLDSLKTQRSAESNFFTPCKAATDLTGVSDECKENYCKELGYCKYEGDECKSECQLVSKQTDKTDAEKKTECLAKSVDNTNFRCKYDNNGPVEDERCHTTSLSVYESNIPTHIQRCKDINTICEVQYENDADDTALKECIKTTCDTNEYCKVENDKCVSMFEEPEEPRSGSGTTSGTTSTSGSTSGTTSTSGSGAGSQTTSGTTSTSGNTSTSGSGNTSTSGSGTPSASGAGSQTTGWYTPYNGSFYSASGINYGSQYTSSQEYNNKFMNNMMYYNDMNNSMNSFMNNFYDTDIRNVDNNNLTNNFNNRNYNEINNFNNDFNNNDYMRYYNSNLSNDLSKDANNTSRKVDTSTKSAIQQHVKGIGSIFIPSITILK